MTAARRPNTGPYVITYKDERGLLFTFERHTWADACGLMRYLIVNNFRDVTVAFC